MWGLLDAHTGGKHAKRQMRGEKTAALTNRSLRRMGVVVFVCLLWGCVKVGQASERTCARSVFCGAISGNECLYVLMSVVSEKYHAVEIPRPWWSFAFWNCRP